MNRNIKTDIESFLSTYHSFRLLNEIDPKGLVLEGTLNVIDSTGYHWESYEIQIMINIEKYPHTVPVVKEKSSKIGRHWDYHISENGTCCLSIPHKLIRRSQIGVRLTNFYVEVIYPFFVNHQHKVHKGYYANGEYSHFSEGIIQFYKETHQLENIPYLISLIQAGLTFYDHKPNDKCPICGGRKYKNCCRKKIYEILPYGRERLLADLKILKGAKR